MTTAQTAWRLRRDDGSETTATWLQWEHPHAGGQKHAYGMRAGEIFRIRIGFEENAGTSTPVTPRLEYRRTPWGGTAGAFTAVTSSSTHVQGAASPNVTDGGATTDQMAAPTGTFTPGEIVEDDGLGGQVTLQNQNTEYEWVIVFVDAAISQGDFYEFRVTDDGSALDAYTEVGTFVYTSKDIDNILPYTAWAEANSLVGPIRDSNGNMYCAGEGGGDGLSGQAPLLWILKSSDEGITWIEADPEGKAAFHHTTIQDAEAAHISIDPAVTGQLQIAKHQTDVDEYPYRMSDHATNPDTWVASETEMFNGTSVGSNQEVRIQGRSDGTVVGIYKADEEAGPLDRIEYAIKSGGSWGAGTELDTTASVAFSGIAIAYDPGNDDIYIFYSDVTNNAIYYKVLNSSDVLSSRQRVDDNGSFAIAHPLVPNVPFWNDGGVKKVLPIWKRTTTGLLVASLIQDKGVPGAEFALSDFAVEDTDGTPLQNNTPVASVSIDDSFTVHFLYSRESDRDIYYGSWTEAGGPSGDVEEIDAVTCNFMSSGGIFTRSGAKIFPIIYDTGDPSTGPFSQFYYEKLLSTPFEGMLGWRED